MTLEFDWRLACVALALGLGCGRSQRESGDAVGAAAGAGGSAGALAGTTASGGSAAAGTANGGSMGAVAGTSANGGSMGAAAGTTATGGSATGGAAGQSGDGGSIAGMGAEAGTDSSGGRGNTGNVAGAAGSGGSPDLPGHDDFIVRSNLMSAYEGLRVFATYDHNFDADSRSDARTAVIANGEFELVWMEGFNRDSFGASVVLFVDVGNDWTCTPDVDRAWVDFQSNLADPGEPEVLEFVPEQEDPSFREISCEEFNTWFDKPYRPPPR